MKRVYFIKPIGALGPVKIGCSANPEQRLRHLTRKDRPLEIVATIEGDFDLERRFHALFRADQIKSEWFKPSPRLERVISAIRRGGFDIESLPPPRRLPRKAIEYTPERRAHMSAMAYRNARWLKAYRHVQRLANAEGRLVWPGEVERHLAETVRATPDRSGIAA